MYNKNRKNVNLYELLTSLTDATDLSHPQLASHHQETAYMAYHIAENMGLSLQERQDVVLAGLLHDIGAISVYERVELVDEEPDDAQDHAIMGADIVEEFPYLKNAADIIRYHHVKWEYGKGEKYNGEKVPLLSSVLYLADRCVVLIDKEKPVIGQIKGIKDKIVSQREIKFRPEVVDAFLKFADKEYIWLDISYKRLYTSIKNLLSFETLNLEIDEVVQLTRIFAGIIDIQNPFTANHSAGVAHTAHKLAQIAGLSEYQCKMMMVAGYVHDIGKLAVSNNIINKNGGLDREEFDAMKGHTYYTYKVLESINGWETINEWASFHHERLNGRGYPFHLSAENLSLGSRIMAVADVFTALTEERPYRKGMDKKSTLKILGDMVKGGSICGRVVKMLSDNYEITNMQRSEAQKNDRESRKNITA